MRRLNRYALLILAFVLLLALHVEAEGQRLVLNVGQLDTSPSLPDELIKILDKAVQVAPVYDSRSEMWPSTTPLPTVMTELPDVVSALVGFYDNDIPALVDNGLLEPLDSLYKELSIDLAKDLPAEILNAITYKGQVWAFPYRVDTFVLKYNPQAMSRVGASPDFSSWETTLNCAEKLSLGAVSDTQISGFSPVKMADEMFGSFLMNVAMDVPKDSPTTFDKLLISYQERKIIQPSEFNWRDPIHDDGIRYALSGAVTVGPSTNIAVVPAALLSSSPKTLRPLGLMQCFAIRKNTPEKLEAARAAIKCLAAKETQLALVGSTLITKPQNARFRYVPVFRHVVASEEFKRIKATAPTYEVLLESCEQAHFAPANPGACGPALQAILERVRTVTNYIMTQGDRMGGFLKLAEPLPVEANAPASAKKSIKEY